jgi:hypothetical protein
MDDLNSTTVVESPFKGIDLPEVFKKPDVIQKFRKLFYLNTSEITEAIQIAEDISATSLVERLEKIRKNIGDELFNALSFEERKFMAETAGALDLGPDVNLERMFKYIEEYEDY